MQSDALVYTVDGVNGVPIAGPGSLGPIAFRWPEPQFVTGISLVTHNASAAELGALLLAITDEDGDPMVLTNGVAGAMSGLSFGGRALEFWPQSPLVRPFDLQRPVAAGDVWRFTLENTSGAPITAEMLLHFRRPMR
jgi:hypothetical protein